MNVGPRAPGPFPSGQARGGNGLDAPRPPNVRTMPAPVQPRRPQPFRRFIPRPPPTRCTRCSGPTTRSTSGWGCTSTWRGRSCSTLSTPSLMRASTRPRPSPQFLPRSVSPTPSTGAGTGPLIRCGGSGRLTSKRRIGCGAAWREHIRPRAAQVLDQRVRVRMDGQPALFHQRGAARFHRPKAGARGEQHLGMGCPRPDGTPKMPTRPSRCASMTGPCPRSLSWSCP